MNCCMLHGTTKHVGGEKENSDSRWESLQQTTAGCLTSFCRIGKAPPVVLTKTSKSVIDCRESAKSIYTPYYMYRQHSIHMTTEQITKYANNSLAWQKKLPTPMKDRWAGEARCHDARFPEIRDALILLLQNNPTICYNQLADQIAWFYGLVERSNGKKCDNLRIMGWCWNEIRQWRPRRRLHDYT